MPAPQFIPDPSYQEEEPLAAPGPVPGYGIESQLRQHTQDLQPERGSQADLIELEKAKRLYKGTEQQKILQQEEDRVKRDLQNKGVLQWTGEQPVNPGSILKQKGPPTFIPDRSRPGMDPFVDEYGRTPDVVKKQVQQVKGTTKEDLKGYAAAATDLLAMIPGMFIQGGATITGMMGGEYAINVDSAVDIGEKVSKMITPSEYMKLSPEARKAYDQFMTIPHGISQTGRVAGRALMNLTAFAQMIKKGVSPSEALQIIADYQENPEKTPAASAIGEAVGELGAWSIVGNPGGALGVGLRPKTRPDVFKPELPREEPGIQRDTGPIDYTKEPMRVEAPPTDIVTKPVPPPRFIPDTEGMGGKVEPRMAPETQSSGLPDSILKDFPDLPPADSGLIPLHRFSKEEQRALEKAGLVEEGKLPDGSTHRGVDPERLWPLRQKRAEELNKNKPKVTQEQKNQGLENRALLYERLAKEQEDLGELGDKQKAKEYREKAAEIRKQKQEEQPKDSTTVIPYDIEGIGVEGYGRREPTLDRSKDMLERAREDELGKYKLPEEQARLREQQKEEDARARGYEADAAAAREREFNERLREGRTDRPPLEFERYSIEDIPKLRGDLKNPEFFEKVPELIPEIAEKDPVVKGKLTEIEKANKEIEEIKQKAKEEALDDTKVWSDKTVGRNEKALKEAEKRQKELEEAERKRDKKVEQLIARLENKHNYFFQTPSEGSIYTSLYDAKAERSWDTLRSRADEVLNWETPSAPSSRELKIQKAQTPELGKPAEPRPSSYQIEKTQTPDLTRRSGEALEHTGREHGVEKTRSLEEMNRPVKVDEPLPERSPEEVSLLKELAKETAQTPYEKSLVDSVSKGSVPEVLSKIKTKSKNPFYRFIAARLEKLGMKDVGMEIYANVVTREGEPAVGGYAVASNKIILRPDVAGKERTLLHEIGHAATVNYMLRNPKNSWVRAMKDLYRHVANYDLGSGTTPYGLTNVKEFVAEGWSNPEFQLYLKRIPSRTTFTSAFKDFINTLRGMLGIPKGKRASAFEEFMDVSEGMLRDIEKIPGGQRAGGPDLFSPALDKLIQKAQKFDLKNKEKSTYNLKPKEAPDKPPERKTPEAVGHLVDEFSLDRRPAQEMLSSPGAMKDISDPAAFSFDNLTQAKSASILSGHPVIKWINDKIHMIEMESKQAVVHAITGEKYDYSRFGLKRYKHHTGSEDGALFLWDKTPAKDLVGMKDKMIETNGIREATREDFASAKEFKIYQAVREQLKKALEVVNEARIAAGEKPIEAIPGYLPMMLKGDYRIFVKNAEGQNVYIAAGNNVRQLRKQVAQLMKEHPDYIVKELPINRDMMRMNDLSAFEEALKIMAKNDPATMALHQAYTKILGGRGFGSHALKRKGGWSGYMGTEPGIQGVHALRDGIEMYLNQAYNYAAGVRKQLAYRELLESKEPKYWKDETGQTHVEYPIEKEIPNVMSYVHNYVQMSRGQYLEHLNILDKALMGAGQKLGVGYTGPKRFLSGVNNLASFFFLTTTRFFLSQPLQQAMTFSKLASEWSRGKSADPVSSLIMGMKNSVVPDPIARRGMEWAARKGYLESKFIEMTKDQFSLTGFANHFGLQEWLAAGAKKKAVELAKSPKHIAALIMSKMELEFVRTLSFNAFEYSTRGTVKNETARFERAARMADYYMVNYMRSERPQIYNKLGPHVGTVMSGLKTFPHNYLAQFVEYLKLAKEGKDFAGLASFVGLALFTGGILGTVGFSELNNLWKTYNAVTGQQTMTPEEWLFTSGVSDWFVFGGISTLTDSDLGLSVAAPSFGDFLSSPSVEWGVKGARDVGALGISKLKGEDTSAEEYRALKQLSPTALKGVVEGAYSRKGEVPVASGKDLTSDYIRSQEEWENREKYGFKSIQEQKMSTRARLERESTQRAKEANKDLISVFADRFLNKEEIDKELIQKYLQNGGDPNSLIPAILEKAKKSLIDRARMKLLENVSGETSFSKLSKLQRMQKYRIIENAIHNASPEELPEIAKQLEQR